MYRHFTRKIFWLVLLLAVLGTLYGYHRYVLAEFTKAYRTYASLAARHAEAAWIPMLPDNPLRRDLNQVLTDVLTSSLSDDARAGRAREGLALLVLAEGHIDALGEVGEDVTKALFTMEDSVNVAALTAHSSEKAIVDLAHRRLNIIADIRGLSYRANHDTKTIFDRIIRDGGALTIEHSTALERLLPEVEEQFNRRSNLYVELEAVDSEVRRAVSDFESTW